MIVGREEFCVARPVHDISLSSVSVLSQWIYKTKKFLDIKPIIHETSQEREIKEKNIYNQENEKHEEFRRAMDIFFY